MLPQWHIAWRTDIDIYIPLSLLQELASGSYRSLNKHGLNLRALYKLESQGRHWQLSPSKDLRQGRRREREGRKCQFQPGALQTSSTGVWEQRRHMSQLWLRTPFASLHPIYCIGALKSWRWCPFTWVRVICSQSANSEANVMQKHSFGLTANYDFPVL